MAKVDKKSWEAICDRTTLFNISILLKGVIYRIEWHEDNTIKEDLEKISAQLDKQIDALSKLYKIERKET